MKQSVILIQSPGEPREHYLSEVRPKKKKITGRVDVLWSIFEKNAKILKIKSQDRKNIFGKLIFFKAVLFGSFEFKLNFSQLSQMSLSTHPVILSFMNFFIAQTSFTPFFLFFNC